MKEKRHVEFDGKGGLICKYLQPKQIQTTLLMQTIVNAHRFLVLSGRKIPLIIETAFTNCDHDVPIRLNQISELVDGRLAHVLVGIVRMAANSARQMGYLISVTFA